MVLAILLNSARDRAGAKVRPSPADAKKASVVLGAEAPSSAGFLFTLRSDEGIYRSPVALYHHRL
jgi:hypothetical protein